MQPADFCLCSPATAAVDLFRSLTKIKPTFRGIAAARVCSGAARRASQPRRKSMLRTLIISAVSGTALTLSTATFAQQGGTAQEARAMLDKAVAAVKADQAVALAMFIKGEGGFLDRELYPFCFRIADGKTLASPKAVPAGTDVRTLKDSP